MNNDKWNPRAYFKPSTRFCTLLISVSMLSCGGSAFAANSAWVTTKTHAHPLQNAVFREYLPANEPINVLIALKLRNEDQLNQLIADQNTPGNPQFRKWRSHDEVHADYAPTQEQAQMVADHLHDAGFTDIRIEPGRLLIAATGSAEVIRHAFNTEIARFVRDGREGIANTQDVQVPAIIADKVQAVLGLQTLDVMHTLQSTDTSGTVQPINPMQFPVVYHASGTPNAYKTTVGIITAGDMSQTISDLNTFANNNGLSPVTTLVQQVWSGSDVEFSLGEWDLDSQTILGIAGGQVQEMIFYSSHTAWNPFSGTTLDDNSLILAMTRAEADDQASVINMSFGGCESAMRADGSLGAGDAILKLAEAQGQTFSASSGDGGAQSCDSYNPGDREWPASSPYVIAVGGTTLSTDAHYNYIGETAWVHGGGGPSNFEDKPSWQANVVPGLTRGVPDLAFDADGLSGAVIIKNGNPITIGGTSLASPLFVGAWARLQTAANNTLGFAAPYIYQWPASVFHDVVSGDNGAYTAAQGWDYTTGFGSFDIYAVGQQLFTSGPHSGDVDGDGKFTLGDLLLVQRYVLHEGALTANQFQNADVYPVGGDGVVTFADWLALQQKVLYPSVH